MSSCQICPEASDGIAQKPRGERDTPGTTLGPSTDVERLNCEEKKRRKNSPGWASPSVRVCTARPTPMKAPEPWRPVPSGSVSVMILFLDKLQHFSGSLPKCLVLCNKIFTECLLPLTLISAIMIRIIGLVYDSGVCAVGKLT